MKVRLCSSAIVLPTIMKLTVVGLVLSLALCQAAEVKTSSRNTEKAEEDEVTQKRALTEGNFGVKEKRAQVLATPSPTPGIEYVDSTESYQSKSPAQGLYATAASPVAKISDVLSGQPLPFTAAIASHLFSPVPIYQARLGSPTTYEVSAPVPSQLAYSEHNIYQQSPQNSVQYFNPTRKIQAIPGKQAQYARLAVPYNQQPQQPVYFQQLQPVQQVQSQQLHYTQQQTQVPQPTQPSQPPQQLLQYNIPQVQYLSQPPPQQITYTQNQVQQPVAYPQGQVSYNQNQVQQPLVYENSEQPQFVQLIQPYQSLPYLRQQVAQPGVIYAKQTETQGSVTYRKPESQPVFLRQQESQPFNYKRQQEVQSEAFAKQQQEIQANEAYLRQQQASNVETNHQQPAQRELKNLQSPATQSKVLEKQNLIQQQNYNDKPQGQNGGAYSYASFSQGPPSSNYVQPQNYVQSSSHYSQPSGADSSSGNSRTSKNQQPQYQQLQQQVIYLRAQQQTPAPQNYQQYQPQLYQSVQQPIYPQGQEVLIQNPGFAVPQLQPLAAAPTYAPVQYFGKFAQSIFGAHPQIK